MPMVEDFDVFFDEEEHGTRVQLDGVDVVGVLDRAYAEVFGMQTIEPMFTMPAAAAPNVGPDSPLVAGVEVFRVRELHPDGTGVVILLLQEQ